MKIIDCSTMYLPFLCKQLGYFPTVLAQCITCTENGEPLAGVVYDAYNGVIIDAHIWIGSGHTPSREWYVAIFDYAFNRLKVKKVVGQVNETNNSALKLDRHFGFVEEARIKDYSDAGDLIFYTMTLEQCRVLNSPKWAKVVDLIARVA